MTEPVAALRRHTSRFLVIYVTFMPFTLWSACGWGAVPASVIIAFLLLGIEEIGVQIEEPFGILPLGAQPFSTAICPEGVMTVSAETHCLVDPASDLQRLRTHNVQSYTPCSVYGSPVRHSPKGVAVTQACDEALRCFACAEKICDTIEANVTSLVEDRYEMSAMVDGLAGKPDRRSRCGHTGTSTSGVGHC